MVTYLPPLKSNLVRKSNQSTTLENKVLNVEKHTEEITQSVGSGVYGQTEQKAQREAME